MLNQDQSDALLDMVGVGLHMRRIEAEGRTPTKAMLDRLKDHHDECLAIGIPEATVVEALAQTVANQEQAVQIESA